MAEIFYPLCDTSPSVLAQLLRIRDAERGRTRTRPSSRASSLPAAGECRGSPRPGAEHVQGT
ncbi:MAG: hypothetical protein K6E40_08995 [Desulfovibrio sp.]|nr:hypothetical protein [Desulfovibrio sp.]